MRRAFVLLIGSVVCVFEADDTHPTPEKCILIGWFPLDCANVAEYAPPGSAFEQWIRSVLASAPPKAKRPPVRGTPRALARARGRRARA